MGSSMALGGGSSTRAQVANVVGRGVLDLGPMNRLGFTGQWKSPYYGPDLRITVSVTPEIR